MLVSVSRKSFLCALAGRPAAAEAGPATLAAELYAASAVLCEGLKIVSVLQAAALTY
jgi:dihydropteroate synthase